MRLGECDGEGELQLALSDHVASCHTSFKMLHAAVLEALRVDGAAFPDSALTLEQIARRPKGGDLTGGGFMALLQGSWYLCWFFRRLGATIGQDVCLYPTSADPMMTEPDLVTLDDGACIDSASLISHIASISSRFRSR